MTETVATKKYPLLLANERIGRLDFFLCILINIAISIIDIVSHIPNISESTYTIINGFVGIFQFYFILVQIIKRLHDSNLNRVYVLIWLTPLVATVVLPVTTQNESVSLLILIPSIFMLYLLFKKGYEHINKYGLPPANILATAVTYTEIPTKTEKTIQKKNNELTDETLFDIEYLHKSTWKTSFLIAGNIYKKKKTNNNKEAQKDSLQYIKQVQRIL